MHNYNFKLLAQSLAFMLLAFLTFLLQDFNFITFKNAICSLYTFNKNCTTFFEFVTNKTCRLTINILLIWLVDKVQLKLFTLKHILVLVCIALILLLIDFWLVNQTTMFYEKMHHLLNTLLYSPLLILVYIANSFKAAFKK